MLQLLVSMKSFRRATYIVTAAHWINDYDPHVHGGKFPIRLLAANFNIYAFKSTLLDFKCLSANTGAQSQPCLIIGSDPLNAYWLFHDDRVGLVDSHTLPAKYASTHVSPASTSCLLDIEYDQGSSAPALH